MARKENTEDSRRELFWAWINERQAIWVRRQRGQKPPWTEDKVLATYKFTNVFRELDAVTLALHQRMDMFAGREALYDRLFHIVAFRAFNLPATYDALVEWNALNRKSHQFDAKKAKKILHDRAKQGEQVFTGAYIITNSGSKRPKIDLVCDALKYIWERRRNLWTAIEKAGTMQGATQAIMEMPMHGPFIAYEVTCDLRWQRDMVLNRAKDRDTWANLGPGAKRGINRILTGRADIAAFKGKGQGDYIAYMRQLLEWAPTQLYRPNFEDMPKLEMREIEHSLCEFDKYMRVQMNEGRPRSKYNYGEKR